AKERDGHDGEEDRSRQAEGDGVGQRQQLVRQEITIHRRHAEQAAHQMPVKTTTARLMSAIPKIGRSWRSTNEAAFKTAGFKAAGAVTANNTKRGWSA